MGLTTRVRYSSGLNHPDYLTLRPPYPRLVGSPAGHGTTDCKTHTPGTKEHGHKHKQGGQVHHGRSSSEAP